MTRCHPLLKTKPYSTRTGFIWDSIVADKLGIDPSYVSRVVNGTRKSLKVRRAILDELSKIKRGLS